MKKHILIPVILGTALCIIAFTGCGGNRSTAESSSQNSKTSKTDQSIVGSWSTKLYGDEYTYTFNADGTGVSDAAGKIMNLTYTIKDGIYTENLEGNASPVERRYRVTNNQFIVEDTYGEEIVYNKK